MQDKNKKMYSVIATGLNTIKCIDASTGEIKRSLKLSGRISSSPVVVGNKATIILQGTSGKQKGYIFNLPSLSQTFSFNVS
jgi:outer membrane protein assembly factor BamB